MVLTTHLLLVLRLRMGRAILLPPLQGHEACNKVNFTFLPFGGPRYRKSNINLDLKIYARMRTGLISLKTQSSGRPWNFIKDR
jgi:hypothetical protein